MVNKNNYWLFMIGLLINWGNLLASDQKGCAGAHVRAVLDGLTDDVIIDLGNPVANLDDLGGHRPTLSPVPELSESFEPGTLRAKLNPQTGLIVPVDTHVRRSVSVVNSNLTSDPQWAMVDLMRQAQEFNVRQAAELRDQQKQQAQDQLRESQRNWRMAICNTTIAAAGAAAAGVAILLQYYS